MKLQLLQHAGLSQNEAKCYLALLKLGSASANEVSRRSGIHRVSVYDALRGLREKGLVSQITKANKLLFEAANPKRIQTLIEEKEVQLAKAKEVIPELALDFGQTTPQEMHSYKGLAGIKTILQLTLEAKGEILDFGAEFKIKEFFPQYYFHWEKARIKKKIPWRIVASSKIGKVKMALAKIRYVPEQFNSSVSTYIFDDKVAIIMWVEEPLGMLIEHKAVHESYKNYFEYLWQTASNAPVTKKTI